MVHGTTSSEPFLSRPLLSYQGKPSVIEIVRMTLVVRRTLCYRYTCMYLSCRNTYSSVSQSLSIPDLCSWTHESIINTGTLVYSLKSLTLSGILRGWNGSVRLCFLVPLLWLPHPPPILVGHSIPPINSSHVLPSVLFPSSCTKNFLLH